ncbi:macro domain-containing protein [Paenibacillus chitinolyticus]|uniref:macro domain-containing protein n=1 Tax=Paenibacillus chitinolyticus TaxID=79263 RepID=UPI0021095BA2|nr:macro domain-containing protein [Paenibacillus chitinolyticus]
MTYHESCYRNSLALASERHARSIAFPNITTGIYRFPKPLAADIAIETVNA